MNHKLVEDVAKALFDAENDCRRDMGELGAEVMNERTYRVSISEWMAKARAAISAIEASGHAIVPKHETRHSMYTSSLEKLPGETT